MQKVPRDAEFYAAGKISPGERPPFLGRARWEIQFWG